MKKFLSLFCFSVLVLPSLAALKPPTWDAIAPDSAKYNYIAPIERPKWVKPVSAVAYVGTFGLVPCYAVMKRKDEKISDNNSKYAKYTNLKVNFEQDIQQCSSTYKKDSELLACYNNVKLAYQNLINNAVGQDVQQAKMNQQINLQRQQIIQNNINSNRPRYYNGTSTINGQTFYHNGVMY